MCEGELIPGCGEGSLHGHMWDWTFDPEVKTTGFLVSTFMYLGLSHEAATHDVSSVSMTIKCPKIL